MKEVTGFPALAVYAEALARHEIPFGVILAENEVHGYVVNREDWAKVEEGYSGGGNVLNPEWTDGSRGEMKPLIVLTDSLEEQAAVWGWIIVGVE